MMLIWDCYEAQDKISRLTGRLMSQSRFVSQEPPPHAQRPPSPLHGPKVTRQFPRNSTRPERHMYRIAC
ncbi:hypothetical protein BJX62DRAFT_215702 [Aspergillus germanicus]